MDEALRKMLARGGPPVPARDANAAILAARESAGGDGGRPARVYEVVLGPEATLDRFLKEQLPKLVYHLESIGSHPPSCPGVLVALFVGESLHLLPAREVIDEALGALAISPAELVARYGTGELRTAVRGPPLALPE